MGNKTGYGVAVARIVRVDVAPMQFRIARPYCRNIQNMLMYL